MEIEMDFYDCFEFEKQFLMKTPDALSPRCKSAIEVSEIAVEVYWKTTN